MSDRSLEEKIDRILEILESREPRWVWAPDARIGPVAQQAPCPNCGIHGALCSHPEQCPYRRERAAKTRDLYTLSSQLGLPAEGEEHVPFCTLPPDHRPGCGITASGAMHPESDAAKRYREMRS